MTIAATAKDEAQKKNFEAALVAEIAALRRFALKRTRNAAMADDLVQDTMVLALSNRARFRMGTNLRAWLFTILKNAHLNHIRKDKRNCEYLDDVDADSLSAAPAQESRMELLETGRAMSRLPRNQRDTILIHTFESASYEETARRCRCSLGTVKSRLSRARARLSHHALPSNNAGMDATSEIQAA